MKAKTNLTMLCDFYELTMANGYFQTGLQDRICYFDVFYRSVPDKGGFAIAAGLVQVVASAARTMRLDLVAIRLW